MATGSRRPQSGVCSFCLSTPPRAQLRMVGDRAACKDCRETPHPTLKRIDEQLSRIRLGGAAA